MIYRRQGQAEKSARARSRPTTRPGHRTAPNLRSPPHASPQNSTNAPRRRSAEICLPDDAQPTASALANPTRTGRTGTGRRDKDRPKVPRQHDPRRELAPASAPRPTFAAHHTLHANTRPTRPGAAAPRFPQPPRSADRQRPRKANAAQELLLHGHRLLLDGVERPDYSPEA